jgi:hypothetical protein
MDSNDDDFMNFMKQLNDKTTTKNYNMDKELEALMNEPDMLHHKKTENNDSSNKK